MATTIDWVVGGIITLLGLAIFYKALKEPLDLLFGFIKGMLIGAKDKLTGESGERGQMIVYGR